MDFNHMDLGHQPKDRLLLLKYTYIKKSHVNSTFDINIGLLSSVVYLRSEEKEEFFSLVVFFHFRFFLVLAQVCCPTHHSPISLTPLVFMSLLTRTEPVLPFSVCLSFTKYHAPVCVFPARSCTVGLRSCGQRFDRELLPGEAEACWSMRK